MSSQHLHFETLFPEELEATRTREELAEVFKANIEDLANRIEEIVHDEVTCLSLPLRNMDEVDLFGVIVLEYLVSRFKRDYMEDVNE